MYEPGACRSTEVFPQLEKDDCVSWLVDEATVIRLSAGKLAGHFQCVPSSMLTASFPAATTAMTPLVRPVAMAASISDTLARGVLNADDRDMLTTLAPLATA